MRLHSGSEGHWGLRPSQTVQLGYQGTFAVAAQGLVAATTETRTVADDPTNNFDTDAPDSNQGIQVHSFTVPPGTTLARFQFVR